MMTLLKRLPTRTVGGRLVSFALFRCSRCGDEVERAVHARRQESCGCLRRHGGYGTPLYNSWAAMLQRCTNPNTVNWARYGGRGIKVCAAWRDFRVFREWALAHGYRPGLQIDRRNNDGDYTPRNCRWVTGTVNVHNSTQVKLTARRVREARKAHAAGSSIAALARKYGVGHTAMSYAIKGVTWGSI